MGTVRLNEVITKMNLENLTPEIDVSKIKIRQPDINRPAVQMTGYFEHFAAGRIQIIGLVEYSYMEQMKQEEKERIYRKFLSLDIPCVVFCRELEPDQTFRKYAVENGVALLMTKSATSNFMAELIRWLNVRLARPDRRLRRRRPDHGRERHRKIRDGAGTDQEGTPACLR